MRLDRRPNEWLPNNRLQLTSAAQAKVHGNARS